jgi:hypothetical protein
MPTDVDYALLAGRAYFDTRGEINRFPIPKDWTLISRVPESSSGFEASAFKNPVTNEIVISFSGKGPEWDSDLWSCIEVNGGSDQVNYRQ